MLVTLTTDFGTADGYVGAMKGVILSHAADATVIDLSHDVPRHDVVAGAFALAVAAPWFPPGTIHLAVVDPGVGGARAEVVVVGDGQIFVGPDNGLLSRACPRPRAAFAIAEAGFRAARPCPTFHGRDVFAVAVGRLAAGARPEQAGPAVELVGRLPGLGPAPAVVHVDRFGNLITDVAGDAVPDGAVVEVAGHVVGPLVATYDRVPPGQLLAYVGSAGTVEIAVREGSAAERLGARRGAPVRLGRP